LSSNEEEGVGRFSRGFSPLQDKPPQRIATRTLKGGGGLIREVSGVQLETVKTSLGRWRLSYYIMKLILRPHYLLSIGKDSKGGGGDGIGNRRRVSFDLLDAFVSGWLSKPVGLSRPAEEAWVGCSEWETPA